MKKVKKIVVAAALAVAMLGITGCSLIEKTDAAKGKQVVAEIGDKKVLRSDVEAKMGPINESLKEKYGDKYESVDEAKEIIDNAKKQILGGLAYSEMLQKYAKDNSIKLDEKAKADFVKERTDYYKTGLQAKDDKELEEKVKAQYGMTMEEFKEQLNDMYLESKVVEYVEAKVLKDTTDEEVAKFKKDSKDKYDAYANQKAVVYLVNSDKAQMDEAMAKINAGEDITTLASKYTTDGGAKTKGFFGFVSVEDLKKQAEEDKIDKNFVDAIEKLKVGENSGIVESEKNDKGELQFGYFIIKVVDTDTGVKLDLFKTKASTGVQTELAEYEKKNVKKYEDRLTN